MKPYAVVVAVMICIGGTAVLGWAQDGVIAGRVADIADWRADKRRGIEIAGERPFTLRDHGFGDSNRPCAVAAASQINGVGRAQTDARWRAADKRNNARELPIV